MNVPVARVPPLMRLLFIPKATQVVLPALLEHDTLLLAAVAAGPGVTLRLATSEDG